jgi:hypothetical protein
VPKPRSRTWASSPGHKFPDEFICKLFVLARKVKKLGLADLIRFGFRRFPKLQKQIPVVLRTRKVVLP